MARLITPVSSCEWRSSTQKSESNYTYPSVPGSPRQSVSIAQSDNRNDIHVQNIPLFNMSTTPSVSKTCHQNKSSGSVATNTFLATLPPTTGSLRPDTPSKMNSPQP